MPEHRTRRAARPQLRLAPEALGIIRRAAEIQGRSISEFVADAAQEAARKTVSEGEIIRLSRAAQKQFADLLLKPPAPVPALKKALARHRSLIMVRSRPPVDRNPS